MTSLKILNCKRCGKSHEMKVDVHADGYAQAHRIATAIWNADTGAVPSTKALAAVLVLRWVLDECHAPTDWVAPVAGLFAELADYAERGMNAHN